MACNGYNHSLGCNCGFGGDTGGNHSNLSTDRSNLFFAYLVGGLSNFRTGEARTYQIKCWWCGLPVFYHTNGYGDTVLFDSIGYPWEIHGCWQEYWEEEKTKQKLSDNRNHIEIKKAIADSLLCRVTGDDLRLDLIIDFEEAVLGSEKIITIPSLSTCNQCKSIVITLENFGVPLLNKPEVRGDHIVTLIFE